MTIPRLVDDRFFAKVHMTSECWWWTAATNQHGHGVFTVRNGYTRGAHRIAYENMVGPIPVGHVLDHLCENPRCVRPDHLQPVPQYVNLARGSSPVAANMAKEYCHRGHEFDRLKRTPRGWTRVCSQCRLIYQREYRKREVAHV